MNDKTAQALIDFLASFNLVFDIDWEHTEACLSDVHRADFIRSTGTFLKPRVRDLSSDWANRGALLHHYRVLLRQLAKHHPTIAEAVEHALDGPD